MNDGRWERYGAAMGFVIVALSVSATVFERSPVSAADFAEHRTALVTQSMLFLASAGVFVWFVSSLRSYLMRAESGTGRLSTVAFGAGIAWAVLNMVAQAFQVGVADDPQGEAPAAMIRMMTAVFTIANLPLAMMLVAVAVVALRYHAFPGWLGWLTVVVAGAPAVLFLSTAIDSGPLAPDGWLSFVLYPFVLVWLVPTTVVMVRRLGTGQSAIPEMPAGLADAGDQRATT
jgi:hypothetical protein